jgi:O-antigen ligase
MIAIARRDPIALTAIALLAGFGILAWLIPPLILPSLAILALAAAAAIAYTMPVATMAAWLILVETTPEMWLSDIIGNHELIIALLKATGLLIIALAALRQGARFDRYNPAYAFALIFIDGLCHGLYPGLTPAASLRSLIGSAAPFATGYLRLTDAMRRTIVRCTIRGPAITILFGIALAIAGIRPLYTVELGAIRLAASSTPAFLGGFAMIAIFAALLEFLRTGRQRAFAWVGLNFIILLATGARVTLATLITAPTSILPTTRRVTLLSLGGAGLGIVLMAASALHVIRVIDLIHLGDAASLSNRQLIWPYFETAARQSPLLGWGIGAGKVVVAMQSPIARLLGTNAAHNEYLRIVVEGGIIGALALLTALTLWLWRGSAAVPAAQRRIIRLVFLAFAVQSLTDNTLIATTSLVFFTWARAVFVNHDESPPHA